jgi:purine-binding chemotaxis protein CheW
VDFDGERTIMGALADSVREVFEMPPDTIEQAPKMGTNINTEYIKGVGKQDDHFVIILDINKIFSPEELSMLRQA